MKKIMALKCSLRYMSVLRSEEKYFSAKRLNASNVLSYRSHRDAPSFISQCFDSGNFGYPLYSARELSLVDKVLMEKFMSNDCFCSYGGEVTIVVEHVSVIEGLVKLIGLDKSCFVFRKANRDGTICFSYIFSDEANWGRFENIRPYLIFLDMVQPLAVQSWVETIYSESDFGSYTKELTRGGIG
jgi:hypothetical protein